MKDEEYVQSVMDGKDYKAGKFAYSLRMRLFCEHLGYLDDESVDLRDPVSQDFYDNVWRRTSSTNTEIYDKVSLSMLLDLKFQRDQGQNRQL